MSNWTTQLPYAHRYITKTFFEGTEADLRLPDGILFVEPIYKTTETHTQLVHSRWSTTAHLERVTGHYYEFSAGQGLQVEGYERLETGYTGSDVAILYRNDGSISVDMFDYQSHFDLNTPYGVGDIVGCGYEFPSRVFFTKNGMYLGHYIAYLGLHALRPEVRALDVVRNPQGSTNWGQRPFMFDIEEYFDKRYARWRSLPLEILENVSAFAFLSQGTDYLPRLRLVCRRWRTLFSRSIVDLSIFTRKDLEDILKILKTPALIHARNVTTQESSGEVWLHRFLASPLRHIKSTSRLTIQTSIRHQIFLQMAPPILSQCIPSILGRTFTELHTLELSKYSFPTWTRFAQVIFAFQRLETLVCSDVTWDTSPATPPTWLGFSKRLRHASFEGMRGQCIAGSLWLFLAGRPREPSDDLVLIPSDVSMIGRFASLILRPKFTIVYDQKQGQPRSCTLSSIRQSQLSTTTDLSFEFEGNGATYQVTRIHARPSRRALRRHDDSILRKVERCSTALSSANLCHFRFELSGLDYDGGPFQRRRVAKIMMRQYSAGLLECRWHGETIEDTEGIKWLNADAVATFGGVEKTYQRGISGQVTWDADALRPHFNFDPPWQPPIIPWIKLYKLHEAQSFGLFIADVAFDVDAEDGLAEFSIPSSIDPGQYFLVVGDYIYCTESFRVIP